MTACSRLLFLSARSTALFLLICLPWLGSAQEAKPASSSDLTKMDIEDLMNVEVDAVYGASKFMQKVTDAPAYVTIVSADEIAKHGYRTLADVLRSVPGIYVNYDGNYSYIAVRGFARPGDYNNRILVLVDGHRINESVYESEYVATEFPIDLDLVERVEVIRGPGSALYGTDAFLAVINVITKRGSDFQGAEISGSVASRQTFQARATYGDLPDHGPQVLFSGTFYHSLGNHQLDYPEFNSPESNNGYAVDADGEAARTFFASAQYGDFALEGVYGSRNKTVPTAPYGAVFNDPRTRTTDTHGYVDAQYDHTLASGWELWGHLAFDQYNYQGTYVMDFVGSGVAPFTLNEDFATGQWLTLAFDVSRVIHKKHHLTLGTEERWNTKQNQENYNLDPYQWHLNDQRSSLDASFYAQDEYSIRTNLILIGGLRFDHDSRFGSSFNPRVGMIYNPWKKTTLKILYGQAFRAPNVFEMFYADGVSSKANPYLNPEKIKTTEVVFDQYFTKHTHFTAAGFYNRISDLISEEMDPTDGRLQFVNWQNVSGKGVDLELAGKWPSGWQGRLAYTLEETRDQITGTRLSNSPKYLAKIDLTAPLIRRRLFASFDSQYLGARQTIEGGCAGGYFVANATLFAPLAVRGLTVSASAYNLFDRRYADPGGPEHRQVTLPQDGRTVALKLTYRFGE